MYGLYKLKAQHEVLPMQNHRILNLILELRRTKPCEVRVPAAKERQSWKSDGLSDVRDPLSHLALVLCIAPVYVFFCHVSHCMSHCIVIFCSQVKVLAYLPVNSSRSGAV